MLSGSVQDNGRVRNERKTLSRPNHLGGHSFSFEDRKKANILISAATYLLLLQTFNLPSCLPTNFPTPTPTIMSSSRPLNSGQLATQLPGVTTYLTGHDESSGKAIVQSVRAGVWTPLFQNKLGFNVIYTTSQFPVSLTNNADITAHDNLLADGTLGLTNPSGTVARLVDFCPGATPMIHRTQSLDYGIVIEGSVEMVLDSGESKIMHRGDVAVQRGTMHGWKNASDTEWARMFFVLQHCEEIHVAGNLYGEDLGTAADVGDIPSSNPGTAAGTEAGAEAGLSSGAP